MVSQVPETPEKHIMLKDTKVENSAETLWHKIIHMTAVICIIDIYAKLYIDVSLKFP